MTRKKRKDKVIERKLGYSNNRNKKKEKVLGHAHFEDGLIEIDPRQSNRSYMDTLIHEKLHLLFPNLSENQIKLKSTELTKLLWDMNYRRVYIK